MSGGVTPYADGQIWDDQDANWAAGFGDGTNGAFSETSGTTNLTQGTPYQYTTFTLGVSATLSASSTSDKPIIIFVQGNCIINGTIDLVGKGNVRGFNYQGDSGSTSTLTPNWGTRGGTASAGTAGGRAGLKGLAFMNFLLNQKTFIMNGTAGGDGNIAGAGAGGASSERNGATGGTGSGIDGGTEGQGGAGGCTILIIVGGTLTFGASSTIETTGADGTNGVSGDAGGGGGGGSGDILIFHRGAKTDSGLSTDVTGGTGGAGSGTGGTGGTGATGTEKIANWATILW